ncbi:hypothetical protein BJY01DRAFT_17753 [Aspergillus pseudoustus]|uniref:DUF7600 domain-containing protein n=1 Tax=Aspergillus pseudoustus TaxID=1810923 RepID=A0ABR4JKM6_9EURO
MASTQSIVPETTEVPSDTHRVGVSIVHGGTDTTYIAGLHPFHGANDNVIRLGYIAAPGTAVHVDTTSLKGFIVSIGATGIHALQIVHGENNTLSPWFGDPLGGAKTRRLMFIEQIVALFAGYDGHKMVYLAAWGKQAPIPERSEQIDTISNHLIWCPELPDPSMHFNESSIFSEFESITDKFLPVMWTSFGGPDGVLLRFLTTVIVVMDRDLMVNVDFCYSGVDDSFPYMIPSTPVQMLARRGSGGSDVASMDIHGSAGEYITSIDVVTHPSYYPDTPCGLEVTTNWGRHCSAFSRNCIFPKRTLLQTVPGTNPTGLYATADEYAIKSLGIISQVDPWGEDHFV